MIQGVVEGGHQPELGQPDAPRGPEDDGRAHAEQNDPDVLHAVIGQEPLEVVLDERVEDAEEGGSRADEEEDRAPPRRPLAEPVEAHAQEAVDAQLDHDARHEGRHVTRGRGMGQRQPDVERNEARLRPEAEGEEGEGEGPESRRQRGRHPRPVGETVASREMGEQEHPRQQAGEARVRDEGVDPARPRHAAVVGVGHHEKVRAEGRELPGHEEGEDVPGDRHESHAGQEAGVGDSETGQPSPPVVEVADGVDRAGHGGPPDEDEEERGEPVDGELDAGGWQESRTRPVPRLAAETGQARGRGERAPEGAGPVRGGPRRARSAREDQGGQTAEREGEEPGGQEQRREGAHRGRRAGSARSAARRARNASSSARGDGGQPATWRSTGTTRLTPPTTA